MSNRNKYPEDNSQRREEIVRWLSKSKFAQRSRCGSMFSVSNASKVKLRSGRVVAIHEWLCEEGIRNYHELLSIRGIAGYYISYSNTNIKLCDKMVFSKIYNLADIPYLIRTHEVLKQQHAIQQQAIIDELARFTNVTNDPDTIIEPTDCILAWEDNNTGLVWDAAQFFTVYVHSPTDISAEILNELNYAGFNDWRSPTLSELKTITTKNRNGLLHIKKPLMATASHRSWSERSSYFRDDTYAFDFMTDEIITCNYFKPKYVMAGTRCVRGKIKISSENWVNTLINWASREHLKDFPSTEKEILNMSSLSTSSGDYFGKDISIPQEISNLSNLETINLSGRSINEIPSIIFKLKKLKSINFSYSKIVRLPNDICNLEDMESIDLSNNSITSIPEEMINLKRIKYINLCGNPKLSLSDKQKIWIKHLKDSGSLVMHDTHHL